MFLYIIFNLFFLNNTYFKHFLNLLFLYLTDSLQASATCVRNSRATGDPLPCHACPIAGHVEHF